MNISGSTTLSCGILTLETNEKKTSIECLRYICDMTMLVPELEWRTARVVCNGELICVAGRITVEEWRKAVY